ncbi:MAG: hypothetical protein V8Q42_05015 [Anaerovoracaceae bacterium]
MARSQLKSEINVKDGGIDIVREGKYIKLEKNVEHITFSGEYSIEKGNQNVFYITERAVFKLTGKGLTLIVDCPPV